MRREEPLRGRAVPLALGVLLEGVADGDGAVAKVLPVHGLDCGVRGLEGGVVNESEAFGVARLGISLDLKRRRVEIRKVSNRKAFSVLLAFMRPTSYAILTLGVVRITPKAENVS